MLDLDLGLGLGLGVGEAFDGCVVDAAGEGVAGGGEEVCEVWRDVDLCFLGGGRRSDIALKLIVSRAGYSLTHHFCPLSSSFFSTTKDEITKLTPLQVSGYFPSPLD